MTVSIECVSYSHHHKVELLKIGDHLYFILGPGLSKQEESFLFVFLLLYKELDLLNEKSFTTSL